MPRCCFSEAAVFFGEPRVQPKWNGEVGDELMAIHLFLGNEEWVSLNPQ